MATYQLNQKTLDKIFATNDEDYVDIATESINSFNKYTQIVVNFEDDIAELKKESPDSYRTRMMDLDKKRKIAHDTCLSSVDILNRIAKNENIRPFCDLGANINSAKDVNRSDIADAIFTWSYENLNNVTNNQMQNLGLTPTNQTNKTTLLQNMLKDEQRTPQQQVMDKYNRLLSQNRYPMIEAEDQFKFVHFLTLDEIDPKMAQTYCFNTLIETNKLKPETSDILESAVTQVKKSKAQHIGIDTPTSKKEHQPLEL